MRLLSLYVAMTLGLGSFALTPASAQAQATPGTTTAGEP